MVSEFIVGRWYKHIRPNNPRQTLCGDMDNVLDGKPHQYIKDRRFDCCGTPWAWVKDDFVLCNSTKEELIKLKNKILAEMDR